MTVFITWFETVDLAFDSHVFYLGMFYESSKQMHYDVNE